MDVNSIIIPEGRQRETNREIDEAFVGSVSRRLINPITLRQTDEGLVLVAGERRLLALKKAQITDLIHNVHFRFLEDLAADEAEIIELEENVKRRDLHWRDYIKAIARVRGILKDTKGLPDSKIAAELNIDRAHLSRCMFVFRNLESPNFRDATSFQQAFSILQSIAERRTVSIVQDIGKAGSSIFQDQDQDQEPQDERNSNSSPNLPAGSNVAPSPSTLAPNPSSIYQSGTNLLADRNLVVPTRELPVVKTILNENFLAWAPNYSGEKFTLIHCDFPYDVKYDSYARSISSVTEDYDFSGFWPLCDALCDNIDRFMSYSAHLMFWFSMKFYSETKARLEKAGLYVHDHPFIWHKTDNSGIIPGRDAIFPRRTYETALLATRGQRPLVRSLANIYGAPMATNSIHPSQKPEPVLRHFFGMLIDETTDVLDPTAGSGTALRVAEELGARRTLGLEINPTYAEAANAGIETARAMRKLSK